MNPVGAGKAILAFIHAVGGVTVSAEEIARRANICEACPKRRTGNGVEEGISKFLGRLANKHKVPEEVAGYHCGVCGCSLMLLVPATEKDLHKDSAAEAADRPAGCWIRNNQT